MEKKNQWSNNRCSTFHTVTQDSLKDVMYDEPLQYLFLSLKCSEIIHGFCGHCLLFIILINVALLE